MISRHSHISSEIFLADVSAGCNGVRKGVGATHGPGIYFYKDLLYSVDPVLFRDRSLSRSQVKMTGVTISTCSRELTIPPSTGGGEWLHHLGPRAVMPAPQSLRTAAGFTPNQIE